MEAIEADFGARSRDLSLFTDIVAAIGPLKHARAHLDALDAAADARRVAGGARRCSAPVRKFVTSQRAWSA